MAFPYIKTLLFLLVSSSLMAQKADTRLELRHLCTEFSGRGYVDSGAIRASEYLAEQFKKSGLKPLGDSYFQQFPFQVNIFPGMVWVNTKGRSLKAGKDFLVNPKSQSIKGTFEIVKVTADLLESDSANQAWKKMDWSNHALFMDTMTLQEEGAQRRYKELTHNALNTPLILVRSKRGLIWSVSKEQANYTLIELEESVELGEQVRVEIEAELVQQDQRNVIGYIPGTAQPDSFLILCAHYDHLGKMGKYTTFPGANDNASGTVMLLEMMRYYEVHPPKYSIAFIAFAAEEAGLVGSRYFVQEDPRIPLNQIRFVMNMDLEGSGSKGITVVNSTIFTEEFALLDSLNTNGSYLSKLQRRGKAANSDHYWFSENGVPAFFIYQMGDYAYYHVPEDDWDALPLTAFNATKALVIDFLSALQNP